VGSVETRNSVLFQNTGWRSVQVAWQKILPILRNWTILCPVKHMEVYTKWIQKLEEMVRNGQPDASDWLMLEQLDEEAIT
jgi:hypothetical protein